MPIKPEQHAKIFEWLQLVKAETRLKGGKRRYELLDYLVQEEIEGRGENLKAYAIALDVLGRGADFDPTTDSIVRVEVARLRDALELYYARSSDPFEPKIVIPKGGYRPSIDIAVEPEEEIESSPELEPAASAKPSRNWHSPMIALVGLLLLALVGASAWLAAFQNPSDSVAPRPSLMPQVAVTAIVQNTDIANSEAFLKQYVEETIRRFGQLYVVRNSTDLLAKGDSQYPLILEVIDSPSGTRSELLVRVVDAKTGSTVADEVVGLSTAGTSGEFEELSAVVTRILSQNGPVVGYLRRTAERPSHFSCIQDALIFRATRTPEERQAIIKCLSEVRSQYPEFGLGGVLLAAFLLDEAKGGRSFDGQDPLLTAREILRDVLDRTPDLPGALVGMADVTFTMGDIETSVLFDEQAIETNPNSPFIRSFYARRLVMAGDNEAAAAQWAKVFDLSAEPNVRHQAFYYISLLDSDQSALRRQQAHLVALEREGVPGLVAILANEEIGQMQRAQEGILSLGNNAAAARAAISEILLQEGFLPAVVAQMEAQFAGLESWQAVFGAEN